MPSVKLLTDHMDPERAAADRWYVSNGVTAVGPVNTDLLARGIEAGKVPMESFVRHEAWKVWRPLSEVAIVTGSDGTALKGESLATAELSRSDAITLEEQASFEALSNPGVSPDRATEPGWPSLEGDSAGADVGQGAADTAWGRSQWFVDSGDEMTPPGIPPFRPPLASVSEPDFAIFTPPPPPPEPSDDTSPLPAPPLLAPLAAPAISAPAVSDAELAEPTARSPRPPLEPASDARPTPRLEPAPRAHVEPSGSVEPRGPVEPATSLADALLLLLSAAAERASAEVALVHHVRDDGAVVACAHGPRMLETLGKRTPLTDPALMAAASGLSIVTEPSPGPAGQAILARLTELGAPVTFALMVPLRPGGRLYGVLEMGRATPFTPAMVAEVGDLVREAEARIDAGHLA